MIWQSIIISLVNLSVGGAALAADGYQLKVTWKQELASHNLDDLSRFKQVSSRERDPLSGQVVQWRGALLADVIDASLKKLPPERRAQIDLIILHNLAGQKALIPRSIINKYPMLLSLSRDGQALGERGPVYSVAPWTSHARISGEGAALETFFVPAVTRIEFGNYQDRYAGFFLKRRTDPAAMRGERLFVQSCVGCHDGAVRGPSLADLAGKSHSRALASNGHPTVRGYPQLSDREQKALVSYLDAYHAENPAGQPTAQLDGK